ncbi:S-adenosylmethionine-dependent methyltransferase [Staphylotrichum tortipilum]|uniref:Alpha N-terminal protein methyltransferase 1 n=1 Tax=Staphylotrichum tortipilum TaxID=2831512 RepID=A0AAN6MIC6_9PEZI|nr:S-adenosylmethionine-dependent methyltransferase [Staphylotrichum longicolle]
MADDDNNNPSSNPSTPSFSSSSPPQANVDARIRKEDGLKYWQGIDASVNGMLGGLPHVTRVDLRGSRNFLAKLGVGSKEGQRVAASALEGGAGIGRVTEGLLLDGIAREVDVIEPIAKFTAALQGKSGVRSIFNMGLQDWNPAEGMQYDLIWIQWCVGHLTDEQLVAFLRRCQAALNPDGGLIVVKENNSTTGEDNFDDVDSSVTREDGSFRRIFEEAGLRLVQSERQKGFQTAKLQLLPVRMYALKPAQ